jgi:acyl-coenzyme A synthetase/AMP-(fatty) acid ligase
MLSIFDEGAPAPCPDPFNLAAHVLAAADRVPDRIALQVVGPAMAERWSYARLAGAVRATGSGLLARGLRPGDRVLMRLGNTVDFPILFLGAIAAGIVPVPTSSQLTVPEVEKIAAEIAPALIVAAPDVALPETPPCEVLAVQDLRRLYDRSPCLWDMGSPDRLAYMIYTSGTSGSPRAVMHAHRAIWARQMMHDGWYGLTEDDRLLHAGAFNWTYTLGTGLLDPWTVGATALIPADGLDPATLPLLMRRYDVTLFAAAPGVYRQILHSLPPGGKAPPLPRLRHVLSAGEKMPEGTRAIWNSATGTQVYEALGMSECSTFISGSPARPAPPGTCGYPQTGRCIAVLDEGGEPVPRGDAGMLAIHLRDPGLFLGYWQAEDETAARFSGDWFLTGDSVSMGDDGAITYLGRNDDMMNAGGFRVSPVEVERAMADFPGVREVAAVEVEVRPGVTVIAAFYVADTDLPEEMLADHAAARLARYKQPRLFRRIEALPRGANNKVARRVLRDGFVA